MGLGLSPVRGFHCQAQRLANVFTEYLPSVVRLALAALLTAAALANIGNSACAQRILWKRRRNGQAKHISVVPEPGEDDGGGLAGRSGQAKHNSVERGQ